MKKSWTEADELKLLFAIIEAAGAKPPCWANIADAMGQGYTTEAVRQHFAKLKNSVKLNAVNGDANVKGSKGARKRKPAPTVGDDIASPAKKTKGPMQVKMEENGIKSEEEEEELDNGMSDEIANASGLEV